MDKQLFREASTKLLVYIAHEIENDPYEKTTTKTNLNSLPIRAIVADLSSARAIYKMNGTLTDKAKEIIVERKHRPLLELSYKFKVQGESDLYQGWKVNKKMQIFELDRDFIRLYIFIKQLSD